MNNATHTPGPWVAQRNYAETTESERINIVAGKTIIAETHHAWLDWEEQEANANILAAAPAMYLALQALLAHEGERELSGIGTEHDSEALEAAKLAAKQALAQVEGR